MHSGAGEGGEAAGKAEREQFGGGAVTRGFGRPYGEL